MGRKFKGMDHGRRISLVFVSMDHIYFIGTILCYSYIISFQKAEFNAEVEPLGAFELSLRNSSIRDREEVNS